MDASQTVGSTNGAGVAACEPVSPAPLPCLLNSLSPEAHQYIHDLEKRVSDLETALQDFCVEQKRKMEAMKGMGQIFFKNPASKMIISAFPKAMQKQLEDFFNDGNG